MQAKLTAKAGCPADDHAANVIPAGIAWHNAICDQESRSPGMIGNHPVGCKVGVALSIAVTGERLGGFDQRQK